MKVFVVQAKNAEDENIIRGVFSSYEKACDFAYGEKLMWFAVSDWEVDAFAEGETEFPPAFVLAQPECDECVWGEDGHYNKICAHCPQCRTNKMPQSLFMSRESAEIYGIAKPKAEHDDCQG